MTDARAPSSSGWMYLALAVFFLAVGVRDLTGEPPRLSTATWELMFAAANALFFWFYRGGPAWVRPAAYGLFLVAVAAALADFFL